MQALVTLALAAALAQAPPAPAAVPPGADLVLVNGHVWDGHGFEERPLYVAAGAFADAPPAGDVRRVDLRGRWVVPPLGEAHTHRFASSRDAAEGRRAFLASGVLYAANLCGPKDARASSGAHVGGASGVDVLFANGGLTATGGHPVKLYEWLHANVYGRPPATFWEENADSSFYIVDDAEGLAAKWPLLLATEPDLVKVLLSRSEEFAERRDDERFYGEKGLDPELLADVVARARAAGLRVAAHVDSSADFRRAVEAGVDLIAHTPGYLARDMSEWERFALTADDARAARARGVVHVTTASVAKGPVAQRLMAHNLRLLRAAGVTVAIGSDQWQDAAAAERRALLELELFEPAELVRAWCQDTPRALFPGRRIGALEAGYEGSLVVLGGDPLADPEQLGAVELVVKRGAVVWTASEARD